MYLCVCVCLYIFCHMASAIKSKRFHSSNGVSIRNNDEYLQESQHCYESTISWAKIGNRHFAEHIWCKMPHNHCNKSKTNRLLSVQLEADMLWPFEWEKFRILFFNIQTEKFQFSFSCIELNNKSIPKGTAKKTKINKQTSKQDWQSKQKLKCEAVRRGDVYAASIVIDSSIFFFISFN